MQGAWWRSAAACWPHLLLPVWFQKKAWVVVERAGVLALSEEEADGEEGGAIYRSVWSVPRPALCVGWQLMAGNLKLFPF